MNAAEFTRREERRERARKEARELRKEALALEHIETRDVFRRNGVGGSEYDGEAIVWNGEKVFYEPEDSMRLMHRFSPLDSPRNWRALIAATSVEEARRAFR